MAEANMKRIWIPLVLSALFIGGCQEELPSASGQADSSAQLASNANESAMANRAVVRSANLVIRVANVQQIESKVAGIMEQAGGYVEASQSNGFETANPMVTMTLRTPAKRFQGTLSELEALGKLRTKEISSEDVTEQIIDLDARMKTLRAQEDSFRAMLSQSRKMADTLAISKELTDVRTQIETLAAQRKAKADMAALSTIVVSFVNESRGMAATSDPDWAKEAWNMSTSALGEAGRGLGALGISVVVLSPIWLPPVALFWWLIARASRPKPHVPKTPTYEM
jgi:hypothetical protein